jgi:hypothetical protein
VTNQSPHRDVLGEQRIVVDEDRPGFPDVDLGTFVWIGSPTDS